MSEESAPSTGHNSGAELSDAEKRALFVNGLAAIDDLEEEKKDIADAIKEAKERICSYGYSKDDIKFAQALRKGDESKMLDKRRREAEIARFLGHPIGTQPDLVDLIDRTPAADKAHEEGKVAGAEGKACSPPYDNATEQGQRWIEGWHEGQADLASAFKKLEVVGGDDDQADLEDAA